jgi:DNA mismatch repair protein MutS2
VPTIGPLGVGDPVMAAALGLRGHITEVGAGQAEVQAGSLRVRVPIAELQPDPRGGRTDRPPERPVRVNVSTPTNLDVELDVRGRRADEAREAVRAHVDAGHLAGMREVRVIHGRGTGAVRAAVRDELDRHPLVERTVPGSADGATTAVIATREAG